MPPRWVFVLFLCSLVSSARSRVVPNAPPPPPVAAPAAPLPQPSFRVKAVGELFAALDTNGDHRLSPGTLCVGDARVF